MMKPNYTVEALSQAMVDAFPGWEFDEDKGRSEIQLKRKDGARLYVGVGRGKNKWEISSGCFIQDAYNFLPYQTAFPSIHVSMAKPPSQVVQEIERRVLIPFEPMFQDVLAKIAKKEAHTLLSHTNALRLSPLVGYDEPRRENNGYEFGMSNPVVKDGENAVYARVRVAGGRIKIELDSVTVGVAEAILRIAQGLQPFPVWGITPVHGKERVGNQNWDCPCAVCKKHAKHVHNGQRTSNEYWDCECDANYIHSNVQDSCNMCEARREDQPDSLRDEVDEMLEKREFQFVEITVADGGDEDLSRFGDRCADSGGVPAND